jgi:hypothetical protein
MASSLSGVLRASCVADHAPGDSDLAESTGAPNALSSARAGFAMPQGTMTA